MRGDAKANGVVDMADALFIAQYIAGNRALGEGPPKVNGVNTASVKDDNGPGGIDQITTADFQYIAQRAVGLRDDCFNLINPPPGGGQTGTATVEVGSATLAPNQQAQIPVTVRGVNDSDGLGGYNLRITFNPAVINVISIGGGAAPFSGAPTYRIDNVAGLVTFNAPQSSIPGPTGDIIVDYLTVRAVGTTGSSTPLDLTVVEVIDATGDNIPAVDQDGTVTIQ